MALIIVQGRRIGNIDRRLGARRHERVDGERHQLSRIDRADVERDRICRLVDRESALRGRC